MDTTIHINVADIPPEVGESFGRVTLALCVRIVVSER